MNLECDKHHMSRCLELAQMASGRTSPNPMVGAVVVNQDGRVVGEGFHKAAGLEHAEVVALNHAGSAAHSGTLYVNLEPCCHWGRTPPCIERVLQSGVKRVVAGMVDPNPNVAGLGINALRNHGVDVSIGVLESQCAWLNRGFIKVMKQGLPWLCLKLATTLDGRIADRAGASRWISGPQARHYVHKLRNFFDCVLVGGKTAKIDDPELNVRGIVGARNPVRAVIDPRLDLSPDQRICSADSGGQTMIFCLAEALSERGIRFPAHIKLVPTDRDPLSDNGWLNLQFVMSVLGKSGINSLLCEGGAQLAAGLLNGGHVDEIQWIISPKIIGDQSSKPALDGTLPVLLDQARILRQVSTSRLGNDILIEGVL